MKNPNVGFLNGSLLIRHPSRNFTESCRDLCLFRASAKAPRNQSAGRPVAVAPDPCHVPYYIILSLSISLSLSLSIYIYIYTHYTHVFTFIMLLYYILFY